MGWHSPTELNRSSSQPCQRLLGQLFRDTEQKTNLWEHAEVNVCHFLLVALDLHKSMATATLNRHSP